MSISLARNSALRTFASQAAVYSVVCLFVCGAATAASATEYHVDDDAAPGGSGTNSSRFDDIDDCAAIMVPGDTCFIHAGSYQKGMVAYQPANSGRPGEPITFMGVEGESRPRISPNPARFVPPFGATCGNGGEPALGWSDGVNGSKQGRDYIRYSGLEINGTLAIYGSGWGNPSVGIEIDNNDIHTGSWRCDPTNVAGVFVAWIQDSVIRDNYIHDMKSPTNSISNGGASGFREGILNFGSVDLTVENNHFREAGLGFFDKHDSVRMVVRRNIFDGNAFQAHISLGNNLGAMNDRGQIYENLFLCQGTGSVGIRVEADVSNYSIFNNTFVNCGERNGAGSYEYGAVYWGGPDNRQNPGNRFFNNILYSDTNDEVLIWLHTGPNQNGLPAQENFNMFHAANGSLKWWKHRFNAASTTASSLSEWRNISGGFDTASTTQNPSFVDPVGGNYRLKPGSPALDAGCDPSGACTSPDGATDLGAYPRDDDTKIGIRGALAQSTASPSFNIVANTPAQANTTAPPAGEINEGVCANPNPQWIACDGFEQPDFSGWQDVQVGNGVLRYQEDVVDDGRYALAGLVAAGTHGDGFAGRFFGDHPLLGGGEPVTEVYWSSKMYFSPGYTFNHGKLFILASFDDWGAGYLQPNSWTPYYMLLQVDPNGEPTAEVHDKTTGVSVWRDMVRNVGGPKPLQPGRWYELSYRAKLNSPGASDGVVQVWIDGELKLDYRDVKFRANQTAHPWNHIMTGPYSTYFPTADQTQYYDDFILSGGPIDRSSAGAPVHASGLAAPGRPYLIR